VRTIDPGRLIAGIDLPPVDLALAAVRLGYRRIHHLEHHRRDVHAGAITLDVRDDRLVGHVEREILADADFLPLGRDFDVLVHVGVWTSSGATTARMTMGGSNGAIGNYAKCAAPG